MAQSTSLEPITPVPDLSPRIPGIVAEAVENRFYSCRSISWRRWSGWLHPIKGLTGFRTCSLDQTFLLPPSLQDWLPDHHQARFLADVVDSLDLRAIYSVYERKDNRGIAAFHLLMLTRLMLYGYAIGLTKSRRIEKATHDDLAFRFLAADQEEDACFGRGNTGDELPAELASAQQRLERIRQAKQELEAEAKQRLEQAGMDIHARKRGPIPKQGAARIPRL